MQCSRSHELTSFRYHPAGLPRWGHYPKPSYRTSIPSVSVVYLSSRRLKSARLLPTLVLGLSSTRQPRLVCSPPRALVPLQRGTSPFERLRLSPSRTIRLSSLMTLAEPR